MIQKILIKGGTLIHPTQAKADLLIEGETISRIGMDLPVDSGTTVIDAKGKLIFSGVIDTHTHMGIPIKDMWSADDFASGSRSALHGGVTSILDFTILKENESLHESLARRQSEAAVSLSDVGFHINVSRFEDRLLAEIPDLIKAGFNSFKTFTTYEEAGMMLDYDQIEVLAKVIAKGGGILMVHSEDNDTIDMAQTPHIAQGQTHPRYHALSRPPQAEARVVQKLGEISDRTGCLIYIVHLNTAEGLRIAAGFSKLLVETCPHYLYLDASSYDRDDGNMFVASPPLRSKEDQKALWEGLLNGQVHTIGSDHCPFCRADKPSGIPFQDIPNGLGGVETLFPLLLASFLMEGFDLGLLARITSGNAAKIFGLDHSKGALEPGLHADINIVDPEKITLDWEGQLETDLDWNAYAGLPALFPEMVFRRGELMQPKKPEMNATGKILRAGSPSQK